MVGDSVCKRAYKSLWTIEMAAFAVACCVLRVAITRANRENNEDARSTDSRLTPPRSNKRGRLVACRFTLKPDLPYKTLGKPSESVTRLYLSVGQLAATHAGAQGYPTLRRRRSTTSISPLAPLAPPTPPAPPAPNTGQSRLILSRLPSLISRTVSAMD